jgi:MFS family permease
LWLGQAVSVLGDIMFSTTLVLWVATGIGKGKPWAPEAVSAVLLAAGVAVLVLGPVAGVFADRWDGRRTMLRADQVRCALSGALALLSFVPTRDLPTGAWLAIVCADVLVLNAVGQFFLPARYTVMREIVRGDADRARAAGIAQATAATLAIIGPPLAAPLLFSVGLQWALLFNALSYLVSFLAISSVKLTPAPSGTGVAPPAGAGKPAARPSVRREFVAGLRYFRGSQFLVALLTLTVIGQLGVGAVDALDVFFLTRNLHASTQLYGCLGAAFGIGGIVGALLAGRVVARIGARRTAWAGLVIGGMLLIVYSRQVTFVGGVALIFAFAVPITMLNTALSPLLIASAPKEYLGRVVAVFYPVAQLAVMVATLLAGWLISAPLRTFAVSLEGLRFGPIDTIYAASGLLVIAAGLYGRRALPSLGASRPDEPAATPAAGPAAEHVAPPASGPAAEPAGAGASADGTGQ